MTKLSALRVTDLTPKNIAHIVEQTEPKGVVLLYIDREGRPGCSWSSMTVKELALLKCALDVFVHNQLIGED